ncbi:probable serine/threonine-protein kinase tsuA [Musca vetustissima]|uniref:probable serine/threonine-protein kinase tsuA n=1 Tax=Musca vetustissima TaxID=27455 RepID=UPI002AB6FA49|nr:probable serine/threonine-protein kinase tsuA [Musca vetustissima]
MANPLLTILLAGYAAILITVTESAAIIENPKLNDLSKGEDGFLELRPNGNLILRGAVEQSPNTLQQALLFKSILNAIRAVPGNTLNELSVKIYGEGVEHKFPPFLERVIQRIQTYFSVYKYTDTTEPLPVKYKPLNDTLYDEIDVTLSSDDVELVKNKTGKPPEETTVMTTSSSTSSSAATSTAAVATTGTVPATTLIVTTNRDDSWTTKPLPAFSGDS